MSTPPGTTTLGVRHAAWLKRDHRSTPDVSVQAMRGWLRLSQLSGVRWPWSARRFIGRSNGLRFTRAALIERDALRDDSILKNRPDLVDAQRRRVQALVRGWLASRLTSYSNTIFALLTFDLPHRALPGIRRLTKTAFTEEVRDADSYCMPGYASTPVCPNVCGLLQPSAVSALCDRAGGLVAAPWRPNLDGTARVYRGQDLFGKSQPLFVPSALERF